MRPAILACAAGTIRADGATELTVFIVPPPDDGYMSRSHNYTADIAPCFQAYFRRQSFPIVLQQGRSYPPSRPLYATGDTRVFEPNH